MNTTAIRVIVTAAGGDLGQAVVKCLRIGSRDYEIHGCDMQTDVTGTLFLEHFHKLPSAGDASYVSRLDSLCREHQIAAVIPCSELEISRLCALDSHPTLPGGARIVSQSSQINAIYGDKLKCFERLDGKVRLADFSDAKERAVAQRFIDSHSFPLCMKERVSSGNKGVIILKTAEEFSYEWPHFRQPLLQAFIEGENLEYSIGVFTHEAETRIISYRRRLDRLGCSWFAELDQPQEVIDYCRQIASVVNAQGSINIQLRVSRSGPLLLEINPRFSSLAAARAACGFNDVEWSVLQVLGLKLPSVLPPPSTFRYQRFIAESVDFGTGLHVPQAWAPRTGA
jgi:carbamoyl-phosphate synthase large subunit